MTNEFRRVVIVSFALMIMVCFAGCQQAVQAVAAANDQWGTTVTLVVEAPGWSPEDVEAKITVPLETALNGIDGLQRLSSVSRRARAVIRATFEPGTATLRARQLVAERVNNVSLPDDVDVKLAPASSDEMLLIAMYDDTPVENARERNEQAGRLRDLAETSLRQRLLTVTGVSDVIVVGGHRKQYQVFPSTKKLAAFNMTPSELAMALHQGNTAVKGNKEVLVRGVGQLQPLDDLADTVIKAPPDGVPVRLKDVADVRIGWISDSARESAEGKQRDATEVQAVILAVQLQPDTGKTTVNKKVNDVVRGFKNQLPQGVKTGRTIDQRFDELVGDLVGKLHQDLPPDVQLERRSTEQLGDVLAIAPTRRIAVKLYGPDLAVLHQKADEVRKRMKEVPGVVNQRMHPQPDEPQLRIEIDRDMAARLGVTSRQVADAFSIAVGDHVVSIIREGDREYDLVMKRNGDDEPRHNPVRTKSGALVQIGSIAKFTLAVVPSAIYRANGHRVIFISCDVKDRTRSEVEADIKKFFDPLPSGYLIDIGH